MATKNAISSKVKAAPKAAAKSKGKSKESKELTKEPIKAVQAAVSAPAKETAKLAKAEKPAKKSVEKAKPVAEAEVAAPTPKIMSAKGKEPKKKAPAAAVPPEEKVDPEWTQFMNQNKAAKPVPYSMSEDYQPKTVISHKVLGLGYVLKSQNNRIEVSFKEGKKTLITNYKK